jgi:hypothetical protein
MNLLDKKEMENDEMENDDRSEVDSEGENPDYASEAGSDISETNENVRAKKDYLELLYDKFGTILDYNNKKISSKEYFIFLAQINSKLEAFDYEDPTANKKLVELEFDFKLLLETIEQKSKKTETVPFMTKEEIAELVAMEYTINALNEEFNDNDVLLDTQYVIDTWKELSDDEQKHIIDLARKKRVVFPLRSRYRTKAEYDAAMDNFFDSFGVFFPGFFRAFEHREKKEIENILKKNKIYKPRSGSVDYEERLLEYYREGVKLMPGYVQKLNPKKIGSPIFQKISSRVPKEYLAEIKEFHKELPVVLSESDQQLQERNKILDRLLKNVSKEHLVSCIMNATRFKQNTEQGVVFMRQSTPAELQELLNERYQKEFKPNIVPRKPKLIEEPEQQRTGKPTWEPEGGYPPPGGYDTVTLKNIEVLLSKEYSQLHLLTEEKRNIERENASGIFVINWKPETVLQQNDVQKWNTFKQDILNSNKNDLAKIILLNEYRAKLLYTHTIELKDDLLNITKEIQLVNKNIKDLETVKLHKQKEELQQRNKGFVQRVPVVTYEPIKYPVITKEIIEQFIRAYKRTLVLATVPDPYKKIDLLELYDLNELQHTTKIQGTPIVNEHMYIKIKKYLLVEIDQQLLHQRFLLAAIEKISNMVSPNTEITSVSRAIENITRNWKQTYNGEVLLDFYGENLFKILQSGDQYKFYKVIREYDALVRMFTPPDEPIYTRPKTTFDGKIYDVEYLDKDWSTHQPLRHYKHELQKNVRTGQYEVVNKMVEKRGKYPFIKRELKTTQEGKVKEIWTEIPQSAVSYSTRFGKKKVKKNKKNNGRCK